MQPRFPSPPVSTGLQAAGRFSVGPAATIFVMACGAAFGIAAQTLLQRAGLDFESMRNDVLAHRTATLHFALAWWACWLLPLGAFLVGPLCTAATHAIVFGGRLMRGLWLAATAIAVPGLAAVGQLRSFPPAATVTTNAVVSLSVVIGSTVLALLGARLLSGMSHNRTATPLGVRASGRDLPGTVPIPATPLGREGSANSGLPFPRTRRRHELVHRSFASARAALVAVFVFAPVSVLAASTVLLHLSPATPVPVWNPWRKTPMGTTSETRSHLQTLLPTDAGGFTIAAATEAPAVPNRVELLAQRQREISTAIGHGPALSERELTFTKGYPQRLAARLAAGLISQSIPQLTTAAGIARNEVFGPRVAQSARIPRAAAESRLRIPRYRHVRYRYAELKPGARRMAIVTPTTF